MTLVTSGTISSSFILFRGNAAPVPMSTVSQSRYSCPSNNPSEAANKDLESDYALTLGGPWGAVL